MHYRKEVDGLRAVAVIPVILFHAGYEHVAGGFVGVDVFFVISGYLITTIILSEKEKGEFSLLDFYERRARRIIPALFLVMLVSIILSWFLLSPPHMLGFSESLIAVAAFSSNILFWTESGYWGVENELKPLLHTWSLAVEEQYYFLFPLFIMFAWKFGIRFIQWSVLIAGLASLSLSQWAAYNLPIANFFLLPMRAWELAIGAGVAFYFLYRTPAVKPAFYRYAARDELLSWTGLGLIAIAIFSFDESTPFPGFYALLPTIGTALVLVFSTKGTYSGRLLGSSSLVAIGLISYSAYLWHQPLFVFARHSRLEEPSALLFAGLSVISLVLAFFSWKYIEAPFREHKRFSRRQVFAFTAAGSFILISFGIIGHLTEGYQFRVDPELGKIISQATRKSYSNDLCLETGSSRAQESKYCVLVPTQNKTAFLYGDSHAQALMYEAQKIFEDTDYGLLFAATSECPPVKGVYRADSRNKTACYEQNNQVYEDILADPHIEYVILSARWTLGMEGSRFDNKEGGVERGSKPRLDIVRNGEFLSHDNYTHRELLANAHIESIQQLLKGGKKVILIYPVPEAGWNVPDYISRYYWVTESVGDETTASTSYRVFRERNKRTIDALDGIGVEDNLHRIRPDRIFCNSELPDRCITHRDGLIYYSDDDHLSDAGAKLVLEQVVSRLR